MRSACIMGLICLFFWGCTEDEESTSQPVSTSGAAGEQGDSESGGQPDATDAGDDQGGESSSVSTPDDAGGSVPGDTPEPSDEGGSMDQGAGGGTPGPGGTADQGGGTSTPAASGGTSGGGTAAGGQAASPGGVESSITGGEETPVPEGGTPLAGGTVGADPESTGGDQTTTDPDPTGGDQTTTDPDPTGGDEATTDPDPTGGDEATTDPSSGGGGTTTNPAGGDQTTTAPNPAGGDQTTTDPTSGGGGITTDPGGGEQTTPHPAGDDQSTTDPTTGGGGATTGGPTGGGITTEPPDTTDAGGQPTGTGPVAGGDDEVRESAACPGVPESGECADDVLRYCEDGEVQEVACDLLGGRCELDAEGYPNCTCQDETFQSQCFDEQFFTECEEGTIYGVYCDDVNGTCAMGDEGPDCRCDPDAYPDQCWDGATLFQCNDAGEILEADCYALGTVCDESPKGAQECRCFEDTPTQCTDPNTAAYCNGDQGVRWIDCRGLSDAVDADESCGTGAGATDPQGCLCSPGEAGQCFDDRHFLSCGEAGVFDLVDCGAEGGKCGTTDEGVPGCVGLGCGDLTAAGTCAQNVLAWCDDAYTKSKDCTEESMVCGRDPQDGTRSACIPENGGCGDVPEAGRCDGNVLLQCDVENQTVRRVDCGAADGTCKTESGASHCDCSPFIVQEFCQGEVLVTCGEDRNLTFTDCRGNDGRCAPDAPVAGRAICTGPGCEGETYFGRCEDDALVYCQYDYVVTIDCAESQETCGYTSAESGFGCVANVPGCGDITYEGRCLGSVLEYCSEDDVLQADNCAAFSKSCGELEEGSADFYCVGCGEETYFGRCEEGEAVFCLDDTVERYQCEELGGFCDIDEDFGSWCFCDPETHQSYCAEDQSLVACDEEGGLEVVDCAELGGECRQDDQGETVCGGPGCGDETEAGRCDGDQIIWCEHDLIREEDCTEYDLTCALDDADGAQCLPQGSDECGDLPPTSQCDGALLTTCEETGSTKRLRVTDCSVTLQTCGPDGTGQAGCRDIEGGCGGLGLAGTCDGDTLTYCEDEQTIAISCAPMGRTCGVSEAENNVRACVPTADQCGDETAAGRCRDETLVYCTEGRTREIECTAYGLTCGEDGPGGVNCVERAPEGRACLTQCGRGFTCQGGVCHSTGTQEREWTVLSYIVGDNNLSPFAYSDVDEMESVGSSPEVAYLVQVEFSSGYTQLAGGGEIPSTLLDDTFRFEVLRDATAGEVNARRLTSGALGNQDMANAESLTAFIRWGMARYPAKRYALFIWNHGGGWVGGFQDETSETEMTLDDLRDGVENSGYFVDLIDFDACLMGQLEVANAFHGLTDVLVQSEFLEPGEGDPYDAIFRGLSGEATMDASTLGRLIVDEYGEFYARKQTASVTKAAVDMSDLDALNVLVSALADALRNAVRTHRLPILEAITATQDYGSGHPHYRDLGDFAAQVAGHDALPATVVAAATALRDHFTAGRSIIAETHQTGTDSGEPDMSGSTGLSVFLPEPVNLLCNFHSNDYDSYVSALSTRERATPWMEFVRELITVEPNPPVDFEGDIQLSWSARGDRQARSNVDLDLYVLDSCGQLHRVSQINTPVGVFGGDSYETGLSEEFFSFHDYVPSGTYHIFVYAPDITEASEAAWPRVTLRSHDAEPRTIERRDGRGALVPMNGRQPLGTSVDDLVSSGDEATRTAILELEYSDIWYVGSMEIQ